MKVPKNQKSSLSPPEDKRGGARPGAGRPRVPRVTVTLPQHLYDFLLFMDERTGKPPDEYATELLTAALVRTINEVADPEQWLEEEQPELREMEIGQELPVLKTHVNVIWKMRRGGVLKEDAPGRWKLHFREKDEPIDGRTIASLLRRGVTTIKEKS